MILGRLALFWIRGMPRMRCITLVNSLSSSVVFIHSNAQLKLSSGLDSAPLSYATPVRTDVTRNCHVVGSSLPPGCGSTEVHMDISSVTTSSASHLLS